MKTVYAQITWAALAGLLSGGGLSRAQNWTATSAPSTNWSCVASSADGSKLTAAVSGGLIYTSTNSGGVWTQSTAPTNFWVSVASSADGSKLIAVAHGTGDGIYCSSDCGATWKSTGGGPAPWICVACSGDGSKLAATTFYAAVVSTDSGATWTYLGPGAVPTYDQLTTVSSSADGNTLAVVIQDPITPSFWIVTTPSSVWLDHVVAGFGRDLCTSVAMSADGTRIVATVNDMAEPAPTNCAGMLLCSSNSGPTWMTNCTPLNTWTSVASSAEGTRLAAVASGGAIYTSTNAGTTWAAASVTNANWSSVASSADGAKLVAVANGGGIYTWQTTPTPTLNITPVGNNLLISWVIPSMDFVLQQNSGLAAGNWKDVPGTPTLDDSTLRNQVTVLASPSTMFYRLLSR